ncbi:MAG: DsbA family protein [Promicromonosporaceae bacterium]|nr:DsbA family protein [Promicromonosporaceae bacterium]
MSKKKPNSVAKSVPATVRAGTVPPEAEAVVGGSWVSNNLMKLLAGIAILAIIGGVIAVAFAGRTPTPEVIDVIPNGASGTGVDPTVGLPIDGTGALTEAVAAPVVVDIYSDFSCPFCQRFEEAYAEQILQLADNPNVSVRLHPVAVLRTGEPGFSTIAGSILLEVAANFPEYVWSVNDFLLANQAEFANMSGAEIVNTLNQAGLNLPPIGQIMTAHGAALSTLTDGFRATGAQGVPHVRVNGQPWSPGDLPWPGNSLLAVAP